jgi:hypothetical protein
MRASVLCALLLVTTAAVGQTDPVAAQALFDEAKRLMAEGHAGDACPKLAESQRLDPGVGTLLNLAECYVQIKQPARAWTTFLEAEAVASREGQAGRARYAKQRASELAARLVRLTVEVPSDARVPSLEVLRDGEVLREPLWGSAVPVDPGPHEIQARAPGYKATVIRVNASQDPVLVRITALEHLDPAPDESTKADEPPPPPPPVVDTTPPLVIDTAPRPIQPLATTSAQRAWGYGVLGTGIAGIAGGAILGILAIERANAATSAGCDATTCPSQNALAISSDAKTFAVGSDVGFAAGASLAVIGFVLVVTAPRTLSSHVSVSSRGVGVMF